MNHKLLEIILSAGGSIKEYDLLKQLNDEYPAFFERLGDSPSLYKRHFLLFHSLYQLKAELVLKNQCLLVSALEIRISLRVENRQDLGECDPLQAFYLDWNNVHLSDSEINEMQRAFWEKYLAVDKKAAAIKTLQLDDVPVLTTKIVKSRFNELALQHHPDKGGNEDAFIAIKQAYECLRILVNK